MAQPSDSGSTSSTRIVSSTRNTRGSGAWSTRGSRTARWSCERSLCWYRHATIHSWSDCTIHVSQTICIRHSTVCTSDASLTLAVLVCGACIANKNVLSCQLISSTIVICFHDLENPILKPSVAHQITIPLASIVLISRALHKDMGALTIRGISGNPWTARISGCTLHSWCASSCIRGRISIGVRTLRSSWSFVCADNRRKSFANRDIEITRRITGSNTIDFVIKLLENRTRNATLTHCCPKAKQCHHIRTANCLVKSATLTIYFYSRSVSSWTITRFCKGQHDVIAISFVVVNRLLES
mmetsp:Transcript_7110/g.11493  ORF Transcript_7110/g.11493 Transcript_7110/m.11493 type:complete len:299 (-) Transcript_7110:457-1353(-)